MPVTRTLWIADGGSRFFLVPDDLQLTEGTLVLRTLGGRTCAAAPEAVAPHEVSDADGRAAARAEVAAFGGVLKDALLRGIGALGAASPEAPEARTARSLDARLAAALGLSREEANDPERLKEAGAAFVDGLLVAAREGARDPAAARAALAPVSEGVRAAGGERVANAIDALPEALDGVLRDPGTVDALNALTERLRAATAELRAGARPRPPDA
jgi:hypothetical protein